MTKTENSENSEKTEISHLKQFQQRQSKNHESYNKPVCVFKFLPGRIQEIVNSENSNGSKYKLFGH